MGKTGKLIFMAIFTLFHLLNVNNCIKKAKIHTCCFHILSHVKILKFPKKGKNSVQNVNFPIKKCKNSFPKCLELISKSPKLISKSPKFISTRPKFISTGFCSSGLGWNSGQKKACTKRCRLLSDFFMAGLKVLGVLRWKLGSYASYA